MLPEELLGLALNAGVAGLLALVVIYWYRVDSRERLEAERKRTREANARTEAERVDKQMLLDVITGNVTAQKEMADAVRDNAGATRELRQVITQLLVVQKQERDR